jgi:hypothetical protein
MCIHSILLLIVSSNIKYYVWVRMSIPTSTVCNIVGQKLLNISIGVKLCITDNV